MTKKTPVPDLEGILIESQEFRATMQQKPQGPRLVTNRRIDSKPHLRQTIPSVTTNIDITALTVRTSNQKKVTVTYQGPSLPRDALGNNIQIYTLGDQIYDTKAERWYDAPNVRIASKGEENGK